MLEIADRVLPLLEEGPVALATVVRTEGTSSPAAGTSLAVSARGDVVGGLPAGCLELAAVERCERLLRGLAGGAPAPRLLGPTWSPLGCDARVELVVHHLAGPAAAAELAAAAAGRPARLGVLLTGPADLLGGLVAAGEGARAGGELEAGLLRARAGLDLDDVRRLVAGRAQPGDVEVPVVRAPGRRRHGGDVADDDVRVLADVRAGAPVLVVVGAGDLGAALAAGAAALGYHVVVVDHRPRFAVPARVPAAAEVVTAPAHEWLADAPLDGRAVVCVLSHDDDLDPLALAAALGRGVAFVGALGSRATHARRLERLALLGVPAQEAARVHGPLGLDLGSRTPAEVALSVLAEVVADRRGATGRPLREGSGPIHPRCSPCG